MTHCDVGASYFVDAVHMLVELRAVSIPVTVVCSDKEVSMDHLVLEERKGTNRGMSEG